MNLKVFDGWRDFPEFLRTTATRGFHGVDRMLDGLGIPPIPTTTRPPAATSALQLNISPPEEFPPVPAQVPAIPGSWATATSPNPPCPAQRQGQAAEGDSERSSRLQAEVQRQLEEYQQRHKGEMERLQLEVMRLREERDRERMLRTVEQGRESWSTTTAASPS